MLIKKKQDQLSVFGTADIFTLLSNNISNYLILCDLINMKHHLFTLTGGYHTIYGENNMSFVADITSF